MKQMDRSYRSNINSKLINIQGDSPRNAVKPQSVPQLKMKNLNQNSTKKVWMNGLQRTQVLIKSNLRNSKSLILPDNLEHISQDSPTEESESHIQEKRKLATLIFILF